jgi:exodeoxyribonuclease VII small subunit
MADDAPARDDLSFEDLSFEDALDRLEAIVERLEDDPPALDEALDAYEDGVALAKECLARLNDAEQRMEELSLDDS